MFNDNIVVNLWHVLSNVDVIKTMETLKLISWRISPCGCSNKIQRNTMTQCGCIAGGAMCVIRIFRMSHKLIVKWLWWFAFECINWWTKMDEHWPLWRHLKFNIIHSLQKTFFQLITCCHLIYRWCLSMIAASRHRLGWLSVWPRDTFKSFLIKWHTLCLRNGPDFGHIEMMHEIRWVHQMTSLTSKRIQIRWTFSSKTIDKDIGFLCLFSTWKWAIHFHSRTR